MTAPFWTEPMWWGHRAMLRGEAVASVVEHATQDVMERPFMMGAGEELAVDWWTLPAVRGRRGSGVNEERHAGGWTRALAVAGNRDGRTGGVRTPASTAQGAGVTLGAAGVVRRRERRDSLDDDSSESADTVEDRFPVMGEPQMALQLWSSSGDSDSGR